MTCFVTSVSTVFQPYQDDVRVIMKVCAREPRLRLLRSPPQAGIEPKKTRFVGHRLTHLATGALAVIPEHGRQRMQ